ncbi:hypothetical protein Taro_049105 [Colocasia esculenta]|uniref:Uncharacterized protein n=1 Tax=Colocasia esculenta TaxID=4460 RepID=A0A843XA24_COLES|nr:hypothetical protein [Colocasia esculenta]
MQVPTSEDDVDGFRWWLVQWLEATEIVYYLAVDYPHTLRLGGIYNYSLDGRLYNFIVGPVSSQAWGKGHGRRGPSRGVTDRRLESGQR